VKAEEDVDEKRKCSKYELRLKCRSGMRCPQSVGRIKSSSVFKVQEAGEVDRVISCLLCFRNCEKLFTYFITDHYPTV
jgi:hypothetical protein